MKTTREQLKALMKELLVEILNEGLGAAQPQVRPIPARPGAPIAGMQTEQRLGNGRRKPAFDSRLDTPVGSRTLTSALKEAVVRESGGNPIMADILADTAMTTLPMQLGHEPPTHSGGGSHGIVQQEQFHGDPTEVFGAGGHMREDGSSHWADLAFMPAKKSA